MCPPAPRKGANPLSSQAMIADLQRPDAYPNRPDRAVILHETHVSWVLLAGPCAYKIKKPIKTGFLDYSTLELREHYCHEEIRLDGRYTDQLYIDVVPIVLEDGHAVVEGSGPPIEFAVKMRRFPDDALMSARLDLGLVTAEEVEQLAEAVASFHDVADHQTDGERFATPDLIAKDLQDCLDDLARSVVAASTSESRTQLQHWADQFLQDHRTNFHDRIGGGFIRECHGDLHLDNVIHLGDRLIPFDGIEFNDSFRWIDVLNDAAFLVMDFVARGHTDFANCFLNAYLQHTGDYESFSLLRWYIVYRSLVRAKVAAIRAAQGEGHDEEPRRDCIDHIALAEQFSRPKPATLWITHGLSGSGKTRATERFISDHGAIRVRSDVERKRLFHLAPTERAGPEQRDELYSPQATQRTYSRLLQLAESVLRGGYSVIVDATFLKKPHRDSFRQLAERLQVGWGIVDCAADMDALRNRITQRQAENRDASDADLDVLEKQFEQQDPLTPSEREAVCR